MVVVSLFFVGIVAIHILHVSNILKRSIRLSHFNNVVADIVAGTAPSKITSKVIANTGHI